MTKLYTLVEGHGEVQAVQNLLTRITREFGPAFPWSTPRRWNNLHQWEPKKCGGVRKGADFIRGMPDAAGLLILRDEDDGCPKCLALEIAARLRDMNLPFPVAYVLMHPKYEVIFLPCLDRMTGKFPDGRRGLTQSTCWGGSSREAHRGIKEWLSKHFPKGRNYKPTMDQLPMTRTIDLASLRDAGVPCFGTLERAVHFLFDTFQCPGAVYPPVDKTSLAGD